MELFFAWIVLSFLVGYYSQKLGRSFFGYFFLSLLLSPLIVFIILLVAGRKTHLASRQKVLHAGECYCKHCGNIVVIGNQYCGFCGNPIKSLNEGLIKQEYILEHTTSDNGQGFVVVRVSDKQRLSWNTLPRSAGLESIPVAGVSHHSDELQDRTFSPGNKLKLIPEPENEYDSNAIGVWNERQDKKIGYLPKDIAKRLSKKLESGIKYHCISMWEHYNEGKRVGVRLLLIREDASIAGLSGL